MKNPDISPISIYITISTLSKLPEEIIKEIYKYLHETLIMENNKEYIKKKNRKFRKKHKCDTTRDAISKKCNNNKIDNTNRNRIKIAKINIKIL